MLAEDIGRTRLMNRRRFFGKGLASCAGIALGALGLRTLEAEPVRHDHTHPLPDAFRSGDVVCFLGQPDSRGAVFLCSGQSVAVQFWRRSKAFEGYEHNVFVDAGGLVLVRTAAEDQKHWDKMKTMSPAECKAYKKSVNW
jgi:hypothetical protein